MLIHLVYQPPTETSTSDDVDPFAVAPDPQNTETNMSSEGVSSDVETQSTPRH